MTFNRSKEEVTSLALIPSILVALSDSVEWMPSLDCSESSGMSTTLTQSALDDAIAGSAIALGEGEVVALATFTFFEGSTIGSVCQLDLFGLRLCDAKDCCVLILIRQRNGILAVCFKPLVNLIKVEER